MRKNKIISCLTDAAAEILNPTLLYERCNLLLSEGKTAEFIEKANMLFNRHFVNIRNRFQVPR